MLNFILSTLIIIASGNENLKDNRDSFYIYTHTNEVLLSYDKDQIYILVEGLIYNEYAVLPNSTIIMPVMDLFLEDGSIIDHTKVMNDLPSINISESEKTGNSWDIGSVKFIDSNQRINKNVMLLKVDKAILSIIVSGFDSDNQLLFSIKIKCKDVTDTFLVTQYQFLKHKKPRLK